MARMFSSDVGLSTTTTREGLFDEARTSPHVPSASTTRTPLTVTRRSIFCPSTGASLSLSAAYSLVSESTTAYLRSSGHSGAMVGELHVLGRPATRSDILRAPAR